MKAYTILDEAHLLGIEGICTMQGKVKLLVSIITVAYTHSVFAGNCLCMVKTLTTVVFVSCTL